MNCDRALAVLSGLKVQKVEAEPAEMDELIAEKLVVEVAPHGLALLFEVQRLAEAHPDEIGTFPAAAAVQAVHDALDAQLKNDWFRMTTGRPKLLAMEEERAALRRLLGGLTDPDTFASLQDAFNKRPLLARGAGYVPCPKVGGGLFGLTERGLVVLGQLGVRAQRFGEAKLKTFLAQLDKQEAKLRAFSEQVDVLAHHVGHVRKNRGQVLVGLVKSDLPAGEAAALYQRAVRAQPPDVAVTCARNAAREGGTTKVLGKLGAAYDALIRAGYPDSPALAGAAKSLLPWNPPESGLPRFAALVRALHDQGSVRGDDLYKLTARLIMADGQPRELVQRALRAAHRLSSERGALVPRPYRLGPASVAIAAMVPADDAVDAACDRLLALELALSRAGLADARTAEGRALDCLPCPGTPTEVVATVHAMMARLSPSLPADERLTLATAFAKRFAF
jgi:hypothetical protein